MLRLQRVSFGGPAAIVTSTGLIVGLHAVTVANFLTRLLLALSFVALVIFVPGPALAYVTVVWGFTLLSGLSYLLARARGVSARSEIAKHCAVALAVVVLSKLVGMGIHAWVGQA